MPTGGRSKRLALFVFNLARCAAVYPFNTQIKDLDKGARLPFNLA